MTEEGDEVRQVYRCALRAPDGSDIAQIDWAWPKGTFVATHNEARVRYRFLRLAPDEGEPAPAQSRILECRRTRAPAVPVR